MTRLNKLEKILETIKEMPRKSITLLFNAPYLLGIANSYFSPYISYYHNNSYKEVRK